MSSSPDPAARETVPESAMEASHQQLLEFAFERIRQYSTSLFGVVPDETPTYCGSGTFVRVESWRCLLTAAHVWELVLRFPKIAFGFQGKPAVAVETERFEERHGTTPEKPEPPEKGKWGRWGPDLALIEIPPDHADALEARGVAFYNLSARRNHPLLAEPVLAKEPRGVVGTPAEFTETSAVDEGTSRVAQAYVGNVFIGSRVLGTHTRNGHDYVDLSLDNRLDDGFPKKYGGMSGSGLWWLGRELDNGKFQCTLQNIFLDGVVYYHYRGDTPAEEMLRAHGRRSVYVVLLDAALAAIP